MRTLRRLLDFLLSTQQLNLKSTNSLIWLQKKESQCLDGELQRDKRNTDILPTTLTLPRKLIILNTWLQSRIKLHADHAGLSLQFNLLNLDTPLLTKLTQSHSLPNNLLTAQKSPISDQKDAMEDGWTMCSIMFKIIMSARNKNTLTLLEMESATIKIARSI